MTGKGKLSVVTLLTALTLSCGASAVRPQDGTEVWNLVSGGEERMVLVHPPATAGEDLPVLLIFHGGYGTAAGAESSYGMSFLADDMGFVAVYPQGLDRHWNDGRIDPDDLSDVVFVEAVLDSLASRFQVDGERIYATGMSNGGIFCHFLAQTLPGTFAGIAPVCGGIADPGFDWFDPAEPLDVLIIQGTDDPLVPYSGGEIGFRGGRGSVLGTPEAVRIWRGVNGCLDDNPTTVNLPQASPEDRCNAVYYLYHGIRDVGLVNIEGGGHVWPGGEQYLPVRVIGRACGDFQAGPFIWRFFQEAHERKTESPGGPERSSTGSMDTGGRT